MTEFENVNANIKRIIRFRGVSSGSESMDLSDAFDIEDINDYDSVEDEK